MQRGATGAEAVSAASTPPATVSSWSARLFKQEKHVAAPGGVQPPKPTAAPQIDTVRVSKNAAQPEMWRAYCAEVAKQPPVVRRLRSGQEQLTVAPQARRTAPPQTGSHVADEIGVQHTGEYLAF